MDRANPLNIVTATGEEPLFSVGDHVKVDTRSPVGHYRVPRYIRGKTAVIEAIIEPGLNNEEEGFGRNAGSKRHYYRIGIPLTEIWPAYAGPADDALRIEVFETWLAPVGAHK